MRKHEPADPDYLEWLERRRSPRFNEAWRTCLGPRCGGRKAFWSSHAGERLCPRCKVAVNRLYGEFDDVPSMEESMTQDTRAAFIAKFDEALTAFSNTNPELDAAVALRWGMGYFAELYARHFGHDEAVKVLAELGRRGLHAYAEKSVPGGRA